MKKFWAVSMALGFVIPAMASNLNVSVKSGGSNSVNVAPSAVVSYEVRGVLTDTNNEGLALVGFTLHFTGGPLAQASTPAGAISCANPMPNFVIPQGITNPAGFGGTVIGGDLVQVGGGQNTINNTADNAPFPIGTVVTGVAKPGSCPAGTGELALATGSLTAPAVEGDYTLQLSDLFANVIKAGQTGTPFWATEAAGAGTITNLTIHVTAGGGNVTLQSADPVTGHSLWRTTKNIVRLRFSGPISALPTASDILIREMTGTNPTCGTFNASVTSGNFTFALGGICTGENAGRLCGHNADCTWGGLNTGTCNIDNATLTIQENATTLQHRHWYEISSAGWSNVTGWGVGPAVPNVQYLVQMGDVSDNNAVATNDAGLVYPKVPCVVNCGDNRREDVSGDLKIQTNDAGLVYPHVPSLSVAKPCGH